MKQHVRRNFLLAAGGIGAILLIALMLALNHLFVFDPLVYTTNSECRRIAQQLESQTYHQATSLSCTFGVPKTISNSSLTARKYTYTIRTSNNQCDGIDPGFDPICYTRAGLITSDGHLYPGLDTVYPFSAGQYDYCATEELQQWGQRSIAPTSSDLYIYEGKLFQRFTYVNAALNLPYGQCTLNGTVLINGDRYVVTNVAVNYHPAKSNDFLTNCEATTVGQNNAAWSECINFMAAAGERLDICENDYQQPPDYTNGLTITSFRTIDRVYHEAGVNSACREAYIQRMAAVQKCAVITDKDLQKTCNTYVSMPEDGYNPYKIRRVFTAL